MATTAEILALKITVKGGKEAERTLKKIASETKKTGAATEKANKKSTSSFKGLKSAITPVTLAIGGLVAAGLIIDRFAERAAVLGNLSRAFGTLTTRIGETTNSMIVGMRRAAGGFVADVELMRQANAAMTLGLPITTESMEELIETAIKLGNAMGIDATRAIESMITGIGRQSRLMLDNIGIIVDTAKAYSKFAAKIGLTTDELTDAQKKLAFYEETITQARIKSQGLTVDTGDLSSKYKQLKTSIKNATDELIRFVGQIGSTDVDVMISKLNRDIAFLESPEAGLTNIFGKTSREDQIETLQAELKTLQVKKQNLAVEKQRLEKVEEIKARSLEEAALLAEMQRTTKNLVEENEKLLAIKRDIVIADMTLPGLFDDATPGPGGPLSLDQSVDPNLGEGDFIDLEFAREQYDGLVELSASAQEAITENERRQQAIRSQTLRKGLGQMFGALSTLFNDNKVFAIASATINTFEAVTAALKNPPGPPWTIPAAVAAGVFGFAQVKAIMKSKPGSGATSIAGSPGGGGSVSVGAGASISGLSTTPTDPVRGPVEIRVFFEGEGFFQVSMDELAQTVAEAYAKQAGFAGIPTGAFTDG